MKSPETSEKSFISIDAGFDMMCTQHFNSEKIMPENATTLNVTIYSTEKYQNHPCLPSLSFFLLVHQKHHHAVENTHF